LVTALTGTIALAGLVGTTILTEIIESKGTTSFATPFGRTVWTEWVARAFLILISGAVVDVPH